MFESATLRLTGWYLAILMSMSILFSAVIFNINYHEIDVRLQNLQRSLIEIAPGVFYRGASPKEINTSRSIQTAEAAIQLFWSLFWVNIGVLLAGGMLSYYFARRTLEPIEKAHEAQSRFTSDASHELRTPLATIKTELEVSLQDPELSVSDARELLSSNLEEVNKLISLSEMLLKLSRFEHADLEKERLDLHDVLAEKLDNYYKDEARFEVVARKNVATDGNHAAIAELMGILIENALRYSPKKSTVTIRIFQHRGMAAFSVHNKAKRIAPEDLERLFDRFYRADSSRTKSNQNGYGLGLSIAKKITDVHHGSIRATSTDDGMTMTVCLPLYRKKA